MLWARSAKIPLLSWAVQKRYFTNMGIEVSIILLKRLLRMCFLSMPNDPCLMFREFKMFSISPLLAPWSRVLSNLSNKFCLPVSSCSRESRCDR